MVILASSQTVDVYISLPIKKMVIYIFLWFSYGFSYGFPMKKNLHIFHSYGETRASVLAPRPPGNRPRPACPGRTCPPFFLKLGKIKKN